MMQRLLFSCGLAVVLWGLGGGPAAEAQVPQPWPQAKRKLVGTWIGTVKPPDPALVEASRDDGYTSPSESVLARLEPLKLTLELRDDRSGVIAGELSGRVLAPQVILWSVESLSPSNEEFELKLTAASESGPRVRLLRFAPYSDNRFVATEVGGDYRVPPLQFERLPPAKTP